MLYAHRSPSAGLVLGTATRLRLLTPLLLCLVILHSLLNFVGRVGCRCSAVEFLVVVGVVAVGILVAMVVVVPAAASYIMFTALRVMSP